MKPHAWISVLFLVSVFGCTEANPLYDSGLDNSPGEADGRVDADVPVEAEDDGDLDADVGIDVDVPEEAEADGDLDADVPVEAEADGEAEADVPSDDRDGDGVLNTDDNCPDAWNPGQEDCDTDGIGDACEGGDTDGDTIPDAIDVCACAPGTSTHDEDGDGLFDDCDNCPLVSNATQDNADLDGLGDACEPPTDPGRALRIERFEPFLALPSDPGWLAPSGTWALGADVYDETDPEASAVAFYDPWGLGDDVFLQAVFRVTALGAGGAGTTKQAGILARTITFTDGTIRWYSCGLDMARDRVEIRHWDGSAYAVLAQQNLGTALAIDTEYRISFLVVGSDLACTLESPVAAPVTATATSTALPFGAPGLRTYRAATSFSGLMVAR